MAKVIIPDTLTNMHKVLEYGEKCVFQENNQFIKSQSDLQDLKHTCSFLLE